MLAPIPVDGFVLAEFDIGDQPKSQQGIDSEQDPPGWIDAVGATVYILEPMQR